MSKPVVFTCPDCKVEHEPPLNQIGRTYRCLNCRRAHWTKLNVQRRLARGLPVGNRANSGRWTPEEDAAIDEDPHVILPGRSAECVTKRRQALGIFLRTRKHPDTGREYSRAEVALFKKLYGTIPAAELAEQFPGRTVHSMYLLARRLGIKASKREPRPKPLARSQHAKVPMMVEAAVQLVEAAKQRSLPYQIRAEVVSELNLAVIDGRVRLDAIKENVKAFITHAYAMFPEIGAHASLDAQLFDDGPTTLGDTIDSTAFRF